MTVQHRHPMRETGDLAIGDTEFRTLARIVHAESGIVLSEGKRGLVVSRLGRRLRSLGLTDFASYCGLVESGAGGEERVQLISALTTNVTRFFREDHHFQALRDRILPDLVSRARRGGRVRIWSAGCSSGEEPYSIAIEVLELCPEAASLDLRLLATDIDPQVLATARAGRYPVEAVDGIAPPRRARHFGSEGEGQVAVAEPLRALITFAPLNLIGDWPMRGAFDVIFCRNVVIYFDAQTRDRLWHRFAAALAPGGSLFIGHSERLGGQAEALFENAGITWYRRNDLPAAEALASP